MAYGKNGATCWPAGAVRTLQKLVEWLEARHAVPHPPVMEYIPPEPSVYAAPVSGVEYISTAPAANSTVPAPTVFAAQVPVVEYISSAPAVYAAPAPVVKYIAPAPAASYAASAPTEHVAHGVHRTSDSWVRRACTR